MSTKIRTTHVGSLPRPQVIADLLVRREKGDEIDPEQFEGLTSVAVDEVVARQRRIGIDIVNDGEMSKIFYGTYVGDRYTGITKTPGRRKLDDEPFKAYPRFAARVDELIARLAINTYECTGPIAVKDTAPLEADLRRLRSAAEKAGATDLFMTAASPGIIAGFITNKYYAGDDEYLAAIAAAMRSEYEAIVAAGFTLQLDCPDLSGSIEEMTTRAEFEAKKMRAVEAINIATAGIDPQRMRMHLCWGNLEAPHDNDLPLSDVFPIVMRARPAMVAFEGGNPRHEHEWAFFEDYKLPDGKTVIPGVIDNTTNFVEHPELVAQRIARFVRVLGPERVIAGVDCGFGTHALLDTVDADVAYAKLRSLVQGAELAASGAFAGAGRY